MLNRELAAMKGESERIMWNRANPSFQTTFIQAELRSEAVQELEKNLGASLESDIDKGLPFKPTIGQDPTLAFNSSIFIAVITTARKDARREVSIEKARRIFTEQTGISMQKEAEEALSKVFFGGFEEAKAGFKNAFYNFVEEVFTEMETKGSLHNMFKDSLERWTQ